MNSLSLKRRKRLLKRIQNKYYLS